MEGSLRVGGRAVAGNKAKASKTAKPFDAMTGQSALTCRACRITCSHIASHAGTAHSFTPP